MNEAAKQVRRVYNPVKIGERIGRLTIAGEAAPYISPQGIVARKVRCICDCGSVVEVVARQIRAGKTQSCGCLMRDRILETNRTHGESRSSGETAEYRTWGRMKRRCTKPQDKSFSDYGGRGIKMCDRWLNSYDAFLQDVGRRPTPAHSIDRIDVNGHYEPGNVRWATKREQNNNTRVNHIIEFNGERLTLAQWSERTKIGHTTIIHRLKSGWTVERALTQPVRKWPSQEMAA